MLFGKRRKPAAVDYDKSGKIPVIRSSICTGEQVAGFKDIASGKFEELMLIRSDQDLREFLCRYRVEETEIKREWWYSTGRRIVCFGNSNTYGCDPRSHLGGRYPKSVHWTGRLKSEGWEVFNKGENGSSIPRLNWETDALTQTILRTGAEALVVMLGSNDLLQRPGLTAEECAGRMEACPAAVRETAPAALKLLLTAPPPM